MNETVRVNSVDIVFYKGDERRAFFGIELFADGKNFREVFRGQSSRNSESSAKNGIKQVYGKFESIKLYLPLKKNEHFI